MNGWIVDGLGVTRGQVLLRGRVLFIRPSVDDEVEARIVLRCAPGQRRDKVAEIVRALFDRGCQVC